MLTYLIILLPILFQMGSPIQVISLGEFILIPVMVWEFFLKQKGKIRIPKGLGIFYFVPIVLTIISSFGGSYFKWDNSITVIVRILYYFILICLAYDRFDFDKGTKLYLFVCCVSASYLIAQVVAYYVAGDLLPIPKNFANLLFNNSESLDTGYYYDIYGFRPASIFIEPSYFADYIAPMIAILLFYEHNDTFVGSLGRKKRLCIAAILTLTILLSTSNMGVIYCAIIWGIFLFANSSGIGMRIQTKFVIIGLGAALFAYMLNSEVFSLLIRRFMSGGSIGARLFRGFIIYKQMPLLNQIIGIGLNNIENFVKLMSITTVFDEADLNFSVTLTNRLITTGIIGLGALITFWVIQFRRKKSLVWRALLIVLLVAFIFEAGEYTSGFPFLFILALSSSERRD